MIDIEHLFFRYPGASNDTLSDISITINEGSLFGLIGPNGAGKTTLISLILGLLKNNTSLIKVNGQPTTNKKQKNLIGYTPQDYAFYPNLSISENLHFFAGIQNLKGQMKNARVEYCLDFCQLTPVASSRACQLSGGQKRRLNIAISLLTDPQILIFDEPTVNIDPQSRIFILEQIKSLQNEGKTILYTSHYMEEIEHLCDHVAIVDHGKILIQGPIESVLPEKKLVVSCENSTAFQSSQFNKLLDAFNFDIEGNTLCFSNVGIDRYFELLDKLKTMDLNITSVNYNKYDLEEFFIKLTNKKLRD